ncbi:MAG: hypothetical protein PHY47_09655 [Lachnospiraceae bacterium]|nr:hypothetical protein [Lachnospiraceae bacterium]
MTEEQRLMLKGMEMLLKKFSVHPDYKMFSVEDIINVSNEVYGEIVKSKNLSETNVQNQIHRGHKR